MIKILEFGLREPAIVDAQGGQEADLLKEEAILLTRDRGQSPQTSSAPRNVPWHIHVVGVRKIDLVQAGITTIIMSAMSTMTAAFRPMRCGTIKPSSVVIVVRGRPRVCVFGYLERQVNDQTVCHLGTQSI